MCVCVVAWFSVLDLYLSVFLEVREHAACSSLFPSKCHSAGHVLDTDDSWL